MYYSPGINFGSSTGFTSNLLNIKSCGNANNEIKGTSTYLLFYVPAGSVQVTVNAIPYGDSNKTLYCKVGNQEAEGKAAKGKTSTTELTFTTKYTTGVTPVYIYAGGTSSLYYIQDITVTITPAPIATIGTNGWTTFCSSLALDLSALTASEGEVKAYYASAASGSTVTMTSTTASAPAGEGLMLKGTAGATITIPIAASGTAIVGNKLKGCPTATAITKETENYANFYVLSASSAQFQNIKIYCDGGNTVNIPAGKAYLDLTGVPLEARSLNITFEDGDESAGVNEVKNEVSSRKAEYYNISGLRVVNPSKGLYIVNGKKVMIK